MDGEDRKKATDGGGKHQKQIDEADKAEEKAMNDEIAKLKQRKDMDLQQILIEVAAKTTELERKKDVKLDKSAARRTRNASGPKPN